ncbi:MAG: hypothetical protein AB1779_01105 [Candidatus Thermoplasmatota archaeon]
MITANMAKQIADAEADKQDTGKEWKPDIKNSKVELLDNETYKVGYMPIWSDSTKMHIGGGFEIHVDRKSGKIKRILWWQ